MGQRQNQKAAARLAIARQSWKLYMHPSRTINVSETLLPKVQAVLRRHRQDSDVLSAMAMVAGQNAIANVSKGDPLQQEALFRLPELEAIHFLGMEGKLWASDLEFFPYQ